MAAERLPPRSRAAAGHANELRLAGEVAKALGIGVQTLHYYERQDLMPPIPRSASGHRLYGPAAIERVEFIRKAQALGLPLAEIREVVRLAARGACPCGHVQGLLAEKLAEVDAHLRELRSFRRELAQLVQRSTDPGLEADDAEICAIVERSAPRTRAAIGQRPLRSRS